MKTHCYEGSDSEVEKVFIGANIWTFEDWNLCCITNCNFSSFGKSIQLELVWCCKSPTSESNIQDMKRLFVCLRALK